MAVETRLGILAAGRLRVGARSSVPPARPQACLLRTRRSLRGHHAMVWRSSVVPVALPDLCGALDAILEPRAEAVRALVGHSLVVGEMAPPFARRRAMHDHTAVLTGRFASSRSSTGWRTTATTRSRLGTYASPRCGPSSAWSRCEPAIVGLATRIVAMKVAGGEVQAHHRRVILDFPTEDVRQACETAHGHGHQRV